MNREFAIIIQARLWSERLPLKTITPIYNGFSILDIIALRVKQLLFKGPLILATGESEKNMELKYQAEKNKLLFFSGSENDVLKRFIDCADKYKLSRLMRICCDNPFLDVGLLKSLLENDVREFDYVSYTVRNKPTILSHFGFFAEIVSVSSLRRASEMSNDSLDREHVTRYIYNHPLEFSLKFIKSPKLIEDANDIRLTVDTKTDFENASTVLKKLMESRSDFDYGFEEVMSVVNRSEALKELMKSQINENSK